MPPWVPVGDRVMSAGAPIQTVILYNHRYTLNTLNILNHVYWLMRIERSETVCINKYEN